MALVTTAPTATEGEQLHAKCIQALKDEHMVDIQITALKKKIKRLRSRGKALQTDTTTKKANTKVALLEYAKVTCRELCDLVYKKFPREIRDIIYGFVTDCNEVLVTKTYDKYGDGFQCLDSKYDTPVQARSFGAVDPLWNSDFIGAAMVRELGENLYRSACFQFEGSFQLLSKFRITDQFRLGFLPVTFVSNVEVCIWCEDYQLGPCFGQSADSDQFVQDGLGEWEVPEYRVRPRRMQTSSDLLLGLESLFGFRSGTTITIKAVLTKYGKYKPIERQEWMCDNIIPLIFPAVERLNDSGHRVRVVLFGDQDDWLLNSFASDWNPTSVEQVTKSFWKYVEREQKAQQQALDDAEADESFSHGSTTPHNNNDDDWGQFSFANHGYDSWNPPPLSQTAAAGEPWVITGQT